MGSPPPDLGAPGAARPGTLLAGRYRLDSPLATGGMARVWLARDEILARPVAVKVLHEHLGSDGSFVARFRAEALAAARLGHPSVVSVYDTCSEQGIEAIVMELVDGTTLRARLDTEGRLPSREAARIGTRIAEALTVAHRAGIVHRDIKPANVLLASDGRVVVTDFGIAKASETGDITTDRQMLGTAKYLAPEQVEGGPIDGRADVYALGVVLFEMTCGRVPFAADSEAGTALARLHQDPPAPRSIRPELEPSFEATIMRALARRPDDRWPDAPALGRALSALAAGRPAIVPVTPPARSSSPAGPDEPTSTVPVARPATAAAPRPAAPAQEWRHPEPPSPPPPEVAPPVEPAPAAPRRRRVLPTVALLAVLVTAVVLAGILGTRLLTGGGTETVTPTAVLAFDPIVKDGENDPDAALAIDGDPETTWATEFYENNPDIADFKEGVGLLFDLGERRTTESLEVTSPSTGWTAEAYVLDDPPGDDPDTWGTALGRHEGIDGSTTLDLDGAEGRWVVLWITHVGDDNAATIADVAVTVRT